jgi:hypothetical protein
MVDICLYFVGCFDLWLLVIKLSIEYSLNTFYAISHEKLIDNLINYIKLKNII